MNRRKQGLRPPTHFAVLIANAELTIFLTLPRIDKSIKAKCQFSFGHNSKKKFGCLLHTPNEYRHRKSFEHKGRFFELIQLDQNI